MKKLCKKNKNEALTILVDDLSIIKFIVLFLFASVFLAIMVFAYEDIYKYNNGLVNWNPSTNTVNIVISTILLLLDLYLLTILVLKIYLMNSFLNISDKTLMFYLWITLRFKLIKKVNNLEQITA
ncbi:hypothetical protein [Mycoplasma sp. 48589B]